jgi:hypothetical protein
VRVWACAMRACQRDVSVAGLAKAPQRRPAVPGVLVEVVQVIVLDLTESCGS